MRNAAVLSFLALAVCGTGCVSAPDVKAVPPVVLAANQADLDGGQRSDTHDWWKVLDNDELHDLIMHGLRDSPSPGIALARLAQAEQGLVIARASRWPSLLGGAGRDVRNISGSSADTRVDSGAVELTWDLGLWGKRRLEIADAQQFRDQKWFEHQAVQLALSATIAETYYRIVELNLQGALLARQVRVSLDLERLIEARFRLGQARVSELYQQREATSGLQQLQLINTTDQETFEKSLDVLLGEVPDAQSRVSRNTSPETPVHLAGGAPEDLIRHRADIRAAYARLRQAALQAGIRFAERLPALQVSANLTSLTEKTVSSEWVGYGLDLAVPLFSGGRLRGLEARALHVLEEEREKYLEVWLTALQEVTTLKWQFQQQRKILHTLSERRGHAQQALAAARNRYVLGDQNYLDVLTALRGLQEADRFLVSEQRQLTVLWIQAMEAIGQPVCAEALECQRRWVVGREVGRE